MNCYLCDSQLTEKDLLHRFKGATENGEEWRCFCKECRKDMNKSSSYKKRSHAYPVSLRKPGLQRYHSY